MIKRTRKHIISCFILLLTIFVLTAPAFAATKEVKPVKKAVQGSKTYKIKNGKLVCVKGSKTTKITNVESTKLYSDGTRIFFDGGYGDANIYSLNLKTGKKKVVCKLSIETHIVSSYKQYLYVRNLKWSYAIDTSTGKKRYLSWSAANAVDIVPYKGYIYDSGSISDDIQKLVVSRYKPNGKRVQTLKGYCDVKLVDGQLYVIKYKVSGDEWKYRVYKTDKLFKNLKAVTKWRKTIPKKYQ